MFFRYNVCMNINQMKYVVVLAEEKSFTKAAKKLFISQPSLSKSIKLLEEELATELFERPTLKLTYSGEIFVRKVRNILKDIENVKVQISDITKEMKSHLIVGVPSHRCYYFIPKILKQLQKEFPNCNVVIEEYPTNILKKMIEEDKIDLFIGTESPNSNNYVKKHIYNEGIYVVYPNSWDINSDKEEISLDVFQDKNFILFSESLTLGYLIRKLCSENNIEINSNIECHNVETVYSMIREGLGVSILPEFYIKFLPEHKNICFKKIKKLNYKRDLSVFYKQDKVLIKPAIRFIEIFKNIV